MSQLFSGWKHGCAQVAVIGGEERLGNVFLMQQRKEQTMGKKSGFVIEGCLPSDVDVPLRIYSAAIKRKNTIPN